MSFLKSLFAFSLMATTTTALAQDQVEEPEALRAALKAGYIRPATNAELKRIIAGNPLYAGASMDQFDAYVIKDERAIDIVAELGGAEAKTFIVPASIKRRDFGYGHSRYLTASGGCLQGECGDCAPEANPTFRSDQLPDYCLYPIPLAPPAPPRS